MANLSQIRKGFDPLMDLFERHSEEVIFADAIQEGHDMIASGFGDNFDAARNADGSSWPERVDDKPHPLLQLSLDMRRAATNQGPGHYFEQTGSGGATYEIGIDDDVIPYARFHVLGTRIHPVRDPIYAAPMVEYAVETAFLKSINEQLGLA